MQNFGERMKEWFKEYFPVILMVSPVIILLVFLIIIATKDQIDMKDNFLKQWNNGYHASDNGKWEMLQAVGHRSGTTYIYKCTKCDAWLELGSPEFNWIKESRGKNGSGI